MTKWYKNLYRRNLVDMHIADWDESFLSKFDIDNYIENLKLAKIQSPMIYLQAHTGLCNYPTTMGKTHNAFKKEPNKTQLLIQKCKDNGMVPVGYYSLIFNNWAEDNHKDWAMLNYKGETWRQQSGVRYGLCCPNNDDYRKFVEEQIKEISQIFELDGIFYDMPYWEMFCHCPSCKAKFRKKYNIDIPVKQDFNDINFLHYLRERQLYMGDFVEFVKNTTKKYMPNTTIEFNYAAVIGCDYLGGSTELVNDGCEFASGDLYGDIYSHSFACKYYYNVTHNQPFEYMTSRCDPNLREHTVLKTESRLTREILLTASHHGASLIIDGIDPIGTLDKRVYKRIGKVFSKQIPYEQYFNGEMLSDIAVFFDSRTQFNSIGYDFTNKWSGVQCIKKLVQNHILSSVISNSNFDNIQKYKVVIAPCLENFDNENILKLIDYVYNGGNLLITSKSEQRLMQEFFGGLYKGLTQDSVVYLRPTNIGKKYFQDFSQEYPAPIKYKLPIYEFSKKIDVLAKMTFPKTHPDDNSTFVSIHLDPPMIKSQIPVSVKTSYGKGQVIWIGASIENDERLPFENIFINCVKDLLGKNNTIQCTCSPNIEILVFDDHNRYIIHFIDLYSKEDIQRKFDLKVKLNFIPHRVYEGKSKKEFKFKYNDGMLYLKGSFIEFTTLIVE